MPRGSKKNANQHNARHENGIVAPGKRVAKQKSNGNLNGSADARSSPSATPVNGKTLSPPPKARSNGSATPAATAAAAASSHAPRKDLPRGGHREEPEEEQYGLDAVDGAPDSMPESHARRPDGHLASRVHAVAASLPVPLTVLLSCPLRDALAILILLLSLPPVLVTVTNSLFAVMTFVPPSGSFTLVPTLTDITSSFSPGTPSFLVTCLIDIVAMTLWIWIPFPALQAFFLDAAQAMVATTLGGGHSYRPGSQDNTLYCVSVVVASHIARYRALFLRPIRHRIEKWGPLIGEFDDKYISKYPVGLDRNWLATVKVFIALHIFCQGVTGMVRRRLHTPRQSTTSASMRVTDPEPSNAYTTSADVPSNPPHSPTELRPRQSFPSLREATRDKISSGKRRRKQANYVRSQQPFWAAIAATKTNIMREYETNRATADAASAKATNPDSLGDAPFLSGENIVWVTEVKETAFFFETGPLPSSHASQESDHDGDESAKEEGVDRTKPLYVRCNKTDWVSIRLVPIPGSGSDHRQRWVGELYGLSAGKTYQISFVRSDDDEVITTQTVATPAATIDVSTATPSTATFSPARPSSPASPTATLKSSIADSEARIADLEAQQRRARKENKASISNLHREIEVFNERLQSNSSNDSNLQSRLSQLTLHKRQVDDAVEAINAEIENSESLPPEEVNEWKSRKAALDSARKKQGDAHNELANHRKTNKQALDARKSEEINAGHKIVRLQGRLKRVSEQHAKLTTVPEDGAVAANKPYQQGRSNSDSSTNNQLGRKFDAARYQKEIDSLNRELQTRTLQNNNVITQVKILEESMRLAEQFNAGLPLSEEATSLNSFYGSGPLSAPDESRPTTPDTDMAAFAVPGGIGTGFGGGRFEHSGTPESSGGMAAPSYAPDMNGNSYPVLYPSFNNNGGFADGAALHYGAAQSNGRMRAGSALSGDSQQFRDSQQFLNPDDDDLVPDKVKRRSGFGGASIGSMRDGSDASGSSGGASPAFKFRGIGGVRMSPGPRP